MSEDIRLLLVDDDKRRLDDIAEKLGKLQDPKFMVTAETNPYTALRFLVDNPGLIEFVFIDHILSNVTRPFGMDDLPDLPDGVEMAREISRRWPNVAIILYSADVQIDQEDEWKALAAGAHRYVHVAPVERLVEEASKEFVSEIHELRDLKRALEEFHEGRRKTGVLQRSVKVGIDLIDRRYKVWFRNQDFWDIVGDSNNSHRFCCACFHGRPWPPCRGCLVSKCLRLSNSQFEEKKAEFQRTFFSPVFPNGKREYKYLLVWTEPIYPLGREDVPIAAVESVVDLTGSPTIEKKTLQEHLKIITSAITELTCPWLAPEKVPIREDGIWLDHDTRKGYSRVRIYRAGIEGKKPVSFGIANEGWLNISIETIKLELNKKPDIEEISSNVKKKFCGNRAVWVPDPNEFVDFDTFSLPVGCTKVPVQFALFKENGEWLGWMAVDEQKEGQEGETRQLGKDDAVALLAYADEIARILEMKLDSTDLSGSKTTEIIEEVKTQIVLAATPQEALQTVIDGIIGFHGIEMGHIRVKKRNNMLEITAGHGYYYEHAETLIPVGTFSSLTTQVVQTGIPVIHRSNTPEIIKCTDRMSPDCADVMRNMDWHGIFPLEAFGEVLGSMSLQGKGEEVFDEETKALCTKLAEIASFVLHDLTLQAEAEERTSERIWRAAASSFAHRIGNCLPAAQTRLSWIIQDPDVSPDVRKDAQVALEAVQWGQRTANSFSKYNKRIDITPQVWNVKEIMEAIIASCKRLTPQKIDIALDFSREAERHIKADLNALKDVFLSFIADSIRYHPARTPEIKIYCDLPSCGPGSCDSGTTLRITYEDNGPGVPLKMKARIFEPFVGIDQDGTGIGLTDAKSVIEAHCGTIIEDGTPGEGIRFIISFPVSMPTNPKQGA